MLGITDGDVPEKVGVGSVGWRSASAGHLFSCSSPLVPSIDSGLSTGE